MAFEVKYRYCGGKPLGTGNFGTVYAGFRVDDRSLVAIKEIKKSMVPEWALLGGVRVPAEIYILKEIVGHIPGCIKFVDFHVKEDNILLVMERPRRCMDLFDYIECQERRRLKEPDAKIFFSQIVKTLSLIEEAGVFHRDIKPENIIVDMDSNQLKIIDFGLSVRPTDKYYTHIDGTEAYFPPEYSYSCRYLWRPSTVWSLGILLYEMICGHLPLPGDVMFFSTFSLEVRELIEHCLRSEPSHRPSLEQILNHPWIKSL